jgi:hypothetical protein
VLHSGSQSRAETSSARGLGLSCAFFSLICRRGIDSRVPLACLFRGLSLFGRREVPGVPATPLRGLITRHSRINLTPSNFLPTALCLVIRASALPRCNFRQVVEPTGDGVSIGFHSLPREPRFLRQCRGSAASFHPGQKEEFLKRGQFLSGQFVGRGLFQWGSRQRYPAGRIDGVPTQEASSIPPSSDRRCCSWSFQPPI